VTNRLILDDPQLGMSPGQAGGWGFFQRQLAEHTAPGYESRVLLADQDFTATTLADVTNLILSLDANVRYWFELTGMYNRTGTEDFTIAFAWDSGGNAATTGDMALGIYADATVNTTVDLLAGQSMATNTRDDCFLFQGWFSCTTAGVLKVTGVNTAETGANDTTLYAGTRLIFQPVFNLAYESNP